MIISGVDSEMTEIQPKQVIAQVKRYLDDHKSKLKEEVTRILGLLLVHYSVPEKDFKTLTKSVSV